eukprot:g12683.t3
MGIATAAQAWSLLGQETAEWLHEEHARWYLSTALAVPVPRGLRVPRFLDCEGSAWDPSWTLFRQRLQEEPPGAALRAGRPVHPAAARLAQRFLWEWPPEAAEYGHQLFARRLARDLAPEQGSGTTGGRYDEDSAAQDGFMSDGAFKGFCLYGFIAAAYVSVVQLLSGTPSRVSIQAALEGLQLALGLLGTTFSLDQLESSSWPFTSLEMRLLAEDLTSELQEQDEMQLTFRWRRPLHLERPDLDVSSHLVLALRQSMDSLDSEDHGRAVLMVQKALAEALPEARLLQC